jgi:hypothetical protein
VDDQLIPIFRRNVFHRGPLGQILRVPNAVRNIVVGSDDVAIAWTKIVLRTSNEVRLLDVPMRRHYNSAVVAKDVAILQDAADLDVRHGEDGLAILLKGLAGKRDNASVAMNGATLDVAD